MLSSKTVTSLVFVDASLQDYQSLISGVIPTAQAILLSPNQDGIEHITNTLHQYPAVDAIHIVSHGSPGTLYLGNTQLSLDTLDRYAWDLQTWFSSSTASAKPQLLLYGCNVAAGDVGSEFLDKLTQVTGAAIAASTTPVGSAALGGNWQLDRQIGAIAADLVILPVIQQSYSAVFAPVLTVVGSTATNGVSPSIVDSDLTITDSVNPNTTLNGAQVAITTNLNANDRLGIQGQAGTSGTISGLNWTYNTGTGILALTGTATIATYEAVLRQVTYYASGATTSAARNVQFSLGTSLANPNNGHFYEFVTSSGISWTTAKTAAAAKNYFGLQGYLVTVTSANENNFASSKLPSGSQGWMGASDAATEGTWIWATGPETGMQFWAGTGSGSTVGGNYANWASGEPNNSNNEDYAHFLVGGQWNDYANTTFVNGYVVEYGGMAGDPIVQLTGNTTLNVDATLPSAPSALDLTTASDSGASSTDNLTNITTPTITGTAVANSTITVYDGATVLGTTGADASGNWSFTPASALSSGTYIITATATSAGKTSGVSSALNITIDTSAPTTPASAPDLNAASDTGASNTDNLTNDATPTFTGSGTAGDLVTLYADGMAVGTATVAGNGTWSVTASALSDGNHTITSTFKDPAGNESTASAGLAIIIDTSAPAAPSSAPDLDAASDTGTSNADDLTNDATPTFTGSGSAGDLVTLYADGMAVGTATVAGDGSWSVTASSLNDGSRTITSTFKDSAGNESSPSTGLTITIDTLPPPAPLPPDLDAASDTGASNTDNITNDTTPTFTGTGSAGDLVTLYADGMAVGTATVAGDGSWSITASTLSSGNHAITSTFTDAAGNTSVPSATLVPFTIDTTAPLSSANPPDLDAASDSGASNIDNITNDTTPTFAGTGTAGDLVTLYADGVAVGTTAVAGDGSWSITASTLGSGNHMITSTFTDSSGNESVASPGLSITLITGAPSGSAIAPDLNAASDSGASNIDNITNDTTPTFTGTGTAGAIITLYINGNAAGTATVAGDGSWSVTAATLSDGNHSITSTYKDLAGNESSASTALALTIDSTPPAAPTAAPDLDAASDTGASNTDNITKNSMLTFKGAPGSGTAGSVVTLYADGVAVGTGTFAADGSWSVTTSPLSSGNRNITSTFKDLAGNESSQSPGLTVTIDATAPSAPTVVDPGTGTGTGTGTDTAKVPNLTNDSTPTLSGSAEKGSTIQVFAGNTPLGTAIVDATGKWNFTPTTTLPDGTYPISFKVTDAAGNVTTAPQPQPLVIDTKPATIKILDFGGDIRESSVNTIKFQFSEGVNNFDLSDVVLTRNGKPVVLQGATLSSSDTQTWSLANIPGFTKDGGDYQISVKPGKAKDAAGNILTTGATDAWLTGYTADARPNIRFGKKQGTKVDDNGGDGSLQGGGNRDTLRGFGGNDRLSGNGGNDRLLGGVGKDDLRGGKGKDKLLGGTDNDRLAGGSSNDRLLGGKGNDRLNGDSGDDVLIGGKGKDILNGGAGKDTFCYNSLKERGDRIRNFESANDLIDLRGIFKAPQFKGENRFAQYHKFVQLAQAGANTIVQIDADGSGNGTKFTTIATLQNTLVSDVHSTNFIIG